MTTGLPAITCPACQTEMGLEAILGTDDARGVVELLARCPGEAGLRKALLRYVGLFAPAKQRLRWGRVEGLLAEIIGLMEAGRVERGGRVHAAPLAYWQAAFDQVTGNATLRRPLKSHGYLLEVLASLADRQAASAERAAETQARGATPVAASAAHQPFAAPAGAAAKDDKKPNPKAAAEALARAKTIVNSRSKTA